MAKKKKKSTTTAVATKAPTGLAIARSGSGITFSWNIGDDNYGSGQNFYWNLGGTRQWGVGGIGKGDTSRSVSISTSGSYSSIEFGVQGERETYKTTVKKKKKKKKVTYNPTMSAWSSKKVTISAPPTPNASFSLNASNEGTFSWSIDVNDSSFAIYHHYEWETISISRHNSYSPPSSWRNASKGSGTATSGSLPIKEDSAWFVGTNYSITRWFRVRSVGPGGASAWRYSYHTYALPRQPYGISASLTRKGSGNGYMCTAKWTAPESFMYPVETATVQYAIAKPNTSATTSGNKRVTSWSCPDTSWTNAGTVNDTGGQDAYTFSIDRNLNADEQVFVRVVAKHDDNEIESGEVFASGAVGFLAKATNVVMQPNPDNFKVNVAARIPSDLDAAFVAIYFRLASTPNKYTTVGILPKTSSNITVQCPDWGEEEFNLGVQVMLADYSPATRPSADEVVEYKITNVKMKATEIQWDEGRVPMPPKAVEAQALNSSTIRVSWEWSWPEANKTELSWADHDDAWESTSEPSTYTVSDLFSSRWNIADIGVGTWYVRARHIREDEDLTLYGLWSDTKVVKLSSAPAIPSLILSDGVTVPDGEITCYWAYVSTDGTAQMQADICEAVFDSETNTYTYNPPFARTETAQHLTFGIADRGWQAGEKHYLAVRVISASGEQSENWSTPVALTIADPINCEISSTTLQKKTIPTDAYEQVSAVKYVPTEDTEIDASKTYYTMDGEVVTNPVIEDIRTYYEAVAAEIDPNQTYYTRSGTEDNYIYTEVINPIVSEIANYFIRLTREVDALTELPMRIKVDGAGTGSQTTITIERSASFHMERPDESEIDGFEGETVYLKTFNNDGWFDIRTEDLIGYLDDRAPYRIIATAKDALGQIAEDKIEFEVYWDHQAIKPSGKVEMDEDYDVAILTPLLVDSYVLTLDHEIIEGKSYYLKIVDPETGEITYDPVLEPVPEGLSTYYEIQEATPTPGDVCDIYRLSVDKPELVYENAEFGKKYVDPYPTIGDYGGYRFVYKTYNGDYTTDDGHIAWYNSNEGENEILDTFTSIINYGGDRVSLPYNLSLSNRWAKDFQQTNYLGGHIQGDWNPAVSRTGTITSVGIVNPDVGSEEDVEVIEAIRRLAVWPGICHVRTPDGSSFAANVNVSEDREQKMINQLANYSLEITRVDTEGLDGMTYKQWKDLIADED